MRSHLYTFTSITLKLQRTLIAEFLQSWTSGGHKWKENSYMNVCIAHCYCALQMHLTGDKSLSRTEVMNISRASGVQEKCSKHISTLGICLKNKWTVSCCPETPILPKSLGLASSLRWILSFVSFIDPPTSLQASLQHKKRTEADWWSHVRSAPGSHENWIAQVNSQEIQIKNGCERDVCVQWKYSLLDGKPHHLPPRERSSCLLQNSSGVVKDALIKNVSDQRCSHDWFPPPPPKT